MACPNNFVFFICIIIVFSVGFSDTVHSKNEERLNDVSNEGDTLQYRRRKAKDHLSTLSPNPTTWVDPHDMIRFPAVESQEQLFETTDETSNLNSNYPILEADDQPLFSDVDGNVIVKKVLMTPHSNVINDLEARGSFQKDQQQMCVLDSIYISRWLKKLIFKIENESNLEISAVSFQLDSIVLDNLKKISAAKSLEITELDILICDMLSQMVVVTRIEAYDWEMLLNSCSDALLVIVYVMSIGFIVYGFHFSFKHHLKLMLFVCGLVVFVLFHWMCLYQRIKTYNHAELSSTHIPDECKMHNFQLFEHVQEYIASKFIKNECDKYLKPFVIDPFLGLCFNVTMFEAIKTVLLLPFSTSSQINGDISQVHVNWLIYMLSFLVMFTFLLIMVYLYGFKRFYRGPFFLISKIFKTPSSIQSTCIKATLKQNPDDYASPSDSLNGQNTNSNRFSFSNIGTYSIQSNEPENFSGPEFSCDSCDAHDQSCSEDDDSYTYSGNASWSDNSCDSPDCPCCINDSQLIQELHVGCRVCDNNNATAGSAGTSRDDSESLFKNESADFTDQLVMEQQRNQGLLKRETACADSSENSPQPIIDPSAG